MYSARLSRVLTEILASTIEYFRSVRNFHSKLNTFEFRRITRSSSKKFSAYSQQRQLFCDLIWFKFLFFWGMLSSLLGRLMFCWPPARCSSLISCRRHNRHDRWLVEISWGPAIGGWQLQKKKKKKEKPCIVQTSSFKYSFIYNVRIEWTDKKRTNHYLSSIQTVHQPYELQETSTFPSLTNLSIQSSSHSKCTKLATKSTT